jgi:hypothetical protein
MTCPTAKHVGIAEMSGGIVKALAVSLQAALAFHRHTRQDTRQSNGLLAKALD